MSAAVISISSPRATFSNGWQTPELSEIWAERPRLAEYFMIGDELLQLSSDGRPTSPSPAGRRNERRSASAAEKPVIHLEHLHKSYGAHAVLKDINLSVHAGEVLAIIGPSGSGKSTLLRCINFLEPPEQGIVTVGDVTLEAATAVSRRDLARLRRNLGMVFQSFNLFPHMSVLRNISLPQERVLRRSRKEADEISMQLLNRVGVADKAQQYPARCSGGQQQRIAIARALALDPKVMLFDEPTSSLDPELGVEVLTVMRGLAESGMTMMVVTHEMGFAENVSDHTAIMADGVILEYGSSREVIRAPKTERAKRFLRAVNDR
jgi:polar amino acid transport system ATP-binding protein